MMKHGKAEQGMKHSEADAQTNPCGMKDCKLAVKDCNECPYKKQEAAK